MSDDAQAQATESDREQPPADEQRPAQVSPGHLLRSARERQNLSLDELVSQTLLSRATIEALEDNAFDRLSQPVFVRGYYRKCAKVLNLSEDEVMAAYAAWTGVAGPSPASPGQVDVVPQDVTPGNARFFGLLLMILVIAAVIGALWLFLPVLRDQMSGTDGDDDANGDVAVTSLISGGDTQSGGQPESAPPADSPAASGAVTQSAATAVDQAATGSPAPAAESSDTAPAAPPTGLQLRFQARSWVEVRDASGERLLSGIVDAGDRRTVEGEPPYRVALGNAPGVAVYAGGERVDIADEIENDNTARFTVNGSSGR